MLYRLSPAAWALATVFVTTVSAASPVDAAFERIYSFDFAAARELAEASIHQDPDDPLAHTALAGTELFGELARLKLLSTEIGGGKMQGRPDPAVWARLQDASQKTTRRAQARLARDPHDGRALLSLMIIHGMERDYLALVEKSYRQSWTSAKLSQQYALELTRRHPQLADAWFTIGFNDYLVSSVPFFLKPFMRMEAAEGNRDLAIANLRKAALGGNYLKGFAQLILTQVYRQSRRSAESQEMLRRLAADYPDNPLSQRPPAE